MTRYPFGVRFWAVHYKKPGMKRFEVFEYRATDLSTGQHIFQSFEHKTVIKMTPDVMLRNGLVPFCLVTSRLIESEARHVQTV